MNLRKICKVTSTAPLNHQDKLLGALSIQPPGFIQDAPKKIPLWLETTAASHQLHPSRQDTWQGASSLLCRPPEAPSPSSPRVYEDPPRVFTVTTSLKELVPSLF